MSLLTFRIIRHPPSLITRADVGRRTYTLGFDVPFIHHIPACHPETRTILLSETRPCQISRMYITHLTSHNGRVAFIIGYYVSNTTSPPPPFSLSLCNSPPFLLVTCRPPLCRSRDLECFNNLHRTTVPITLDSSSLPLFFFSSPLHSPFRSFRRARARAGGAAVRILGSLRRAPRVKSTRSASPPQIFYLNLTLSERTLPNSERRLEPSTLQPTTTILSVINLRVVLLS